MKLLVAVALATGALVLSAGSSTAGAIRATPQLHGLDRRPTHTTPFAPAARTTKPKPAPFNCISSCTDYESTINQYFTDVAAASVASATDNVYSVLTQYSSILYSQTFGGSYVDTKPFPSTKTCHDGFDAYCVTDKQLQTEIGNVIAANGWPTQSPTTLYFIFMPANVGVCQSAGQADFVNNPCTTNAFCAYHGSTTNFIYAVEPDDLAVSEDGCDTGESPAGNSADSTLNTVSHEQSEAITNPYPLSVTPAWTSDDPETYMGIPNAFKGSEIGDLCAWNFGASLGGDPGAEYNQVINGHDYFLQQEYSNADGGCVQYAGGTPTNFASNDPLYSGVGPLVDHGGAVMTSNTVYAIYWVPAAPANHRLPTVAGTPKVGKTLRVFHGAWSNTPTFTYQWLRCSTSGKSCRSMRKATASSYRLIPADAGHRVEVRVTATNIAGRANATSAPTAKVKA